MGQSEQIGELAKALAAAQAEMKFAPRESENPYFKSKYADLASVWDAVRAPLGKHDLAITQTFEVVPGEDRAVLIETTLMHSSGQWKTSYLRMLAKSKDATVTPQDIGSCITYGRRYSLEAMAGIAPADDDGNGASGKSKSPLETKLEASVAQVKKPQPQPQLVPKPAPKSALAPEELFS